MFNSTRKHLLNLNSQILKTLPVRKLQGQKGCNPMGSDATKITSLLNIAILKKPWKTDVLIVLNGKHYILTTIHSLA